MTIDDRKARRVFTVLGVLVALSPLLAFCGFTAPIEFLFFIAAGWTFFLRRTIPQVEVAWPNAGFAAIALMMFVVGLHGFLRWWSPARRAARNSSRWPFTRSLAAAMLVATLFMAGLSGVGLVHQLVWMVGDDEPLFDGHFTAHFRSMSSNNLHQIGIGAHNYADAYGALPPGGIRDERGQMLHGWHTLLLPYVSDRAEAGIDFQQPWDGPTNATNFKRVIPAYVAPWRATPPPFDERGFAISHYTGNVLAMGGDQSRTFQQIKDGTSNTMLAGEAVERPLAWGFPAHWRDPRLGINRSSQGFGGWSGTGAQFVFADASAKFISKDIDPRVLEAIATPAGKEKIPLNDF